MRLGKWPEAEALALTWEPRMRNIGTLPLDITEEDMLLADSMNWDHRDPLDRTLAAQAMLRGYTLVTADSVFSGIPGLKILPA
ncbi:hypothetical protein CYJ40_06250 [Brevibacterium ravenspurgense]|uniref:PIN domain-containing protein n=1 Tax=Brevibacterium ravenspurgense TaxID=479117 RepID=A0A2I1IGS3_9MICO|nr:hypothetical protein CYJ40_06250 [Brevibacterium ravenspurgense]